MANETIYGTFRQTNLTNESDEYLAKREERRRPLPQGATLQDYTFEEGPANLDSGATPARTVRLSELFTLPDRALVIYHLMYGKKQTKPCPMCTAWIDGLNGVADHLAQNINLAIVAAADLPVLRAHARARGWKKLRLLSAGSNTFKYDLGSEDRDGNQDSTISVFSLSSDGAVRHFYSAHPRMASDIQERGIDLLSPIWNMLDLTPQGRGTWYTKIEYPKLAASNRSQD